MRHSLRRLAVFLIASLPAVPALGEVKEVLRLRECRDVVSELARSQEGIPGDLLDKAVRINLELVVNRLKESPVLSEALHENKLKIVGARYDLETGVVEFTA